MRSLRVRKSNRNRVIQATAGLLVVVLTIALFPLPFVSMPAKGAKDLSKPFPCQDRPCGCLSAAQCKKKCCCFSADQKVAWAKKNHRPISDVLDIAAERQPPQIVRNSSCCETKVSARQDRPACLTKIANRSSSGGNRVSVVIAALAQQCHGIAVTAFGQPIYILTAPACTICSISLNGERVAPWIPGLIQPESEPPVPPPRLNHV